MSTPRKPAPDFDDIQPWGAYAPTGAVRRRIAWCRRLNPAWPLSYRLALLLRHGIKHGADSPLDIELWGLRLRLLPRGNRSEVQLLFNPQFFDPEERQWLAGRLRPGATFLDIGANAGGYSLFLRSRFGADLRILAVEPDPEMQRRLAWNLASNRIDNVEVCPFALSDHDGEMRLTLDTAQRGKNQLDDAGLDEGAPEAAGTTADTVVVPVTTLTTVLRTRRIDRVDAIKIDIEGHEQRVLEHFFEHAPVPVWPGAVVIEHKPDTAGPLRALFERHGYRIAQRTRNNWMLERAAG